MVSAYDQERKGFWHEPEGTATSEAIALATWGPYAHQALIEVAGDYHAVIREADLVRRVQTDSGVHTTRAPERWLRKLLAPLALEQAQAGEPALTALVVDANGWVGERYDDILRSTDQLAIAEHTPRERHAAQARLECYRWAGSAPADGGLPAAVPLAGGRTPRAPRAAKAPRATAGSAGAAATPRVRATREPRAAAQRTAASDRTFNVCPTCFMAIPATGVCDNCG